MDSGSTVVAREAAMVPDRTEVVERLYARHRDQVFRLALRYAAGDAEWAESGRRM